MHSIVTLLYENKIYQYVIFNAKENQKAFQITLAKLLLCLASKKD